MTDEEKAAEQQASDDAAAIAAAEAAEAERLAAEAASKETDEEKAAREEREAAEAAAAQEKKFTDKDMKDTRLKYQKESREERDLRIAAETEARVLREIIAGKKTTETEPKVETVATKPVRPVEGDFPDREAFDVAMDKYEEDSYIYRSNKARIAEEEKAREESAKTAQQTIRQAVTKSLEDGRAKYEDFDEVVVKNKAMVSPPMMTAAIVKMTNAADVAYHLGKNPAESKRLANISDPIDLALAVREISDTLKSGKPAEKLVTTPQKVATKAPAPAATVSGKAKVATANTNLEGKSQAERMALIEEAARKRRLASAGRT